MKVAVLMPFSAVCYRRCWDECTSKQRTRTVAGSCSKRFLMRILLWYALFELFLAFFPTLKHAEYPLRTM